MPAQVPTSAEFTAAVAGLKTQITAGFDQVRAGLAELGVQLGRVEGLVSAGPVPQGRVTRVGTKLMLNGRQYKAAGMNWDQAVGCGWPGSQPSREQADRYFAELNPRSLTRVWVMPGMLPRKPDGDYDWGRYDLLVEAAARHGQYLCVCLLNGNSDCTSRRASYETPVAADIADWVRRVVGRHRGNHAVAVVEPCNEADEGNPNIGRWYGEVARLIKAADPGVLVGTGGGNNSNDPARIAAFASHPDVDLISYHDYYGSWQSRAPRAAIFEDAAGRAGKPWYFDEVGGCCGGWDGGSYEENGRRLGEVYRLHLGMERCAGVLYWDHKLVQDEPTTANSGKGDALWRAACAYDNSAFNG